MILNIWIAKQFDVLRNLYKIFKIFMSLMIQHVSAAQLLIQTYDKHKHYLRHSTLLSWTMISKNKRILECAYNIHVPIKY